MPLPRFLRKLIPSITRQTTWDGQAGWYPLMVNDPTVYQTNGRTVRIQGFQEHPIVSACVRVIVDQASTVPLESYRRFSDGTTEDAPEHALGKFLREPSGTITPLKLRKHLIAHYVNYGNGFQYLDRSGRGRPTRLLPIHPENVRTVTMTSDGWDVLSYSWADISGGTRVSDVDDIIHVADMTLNPDWWFGYPRLAAALLEITADREASEFVRQIYTNYGIPGGAVLTESNDPTALRAAESSWHEEMASRGGRGKFRFLSKGIKDIKTFGFNMRELEGPEMRSVTREGICSAAGVDPRLIGVASASNDAGLSGAQYAEARRRLFTQTILPIFREIEAVYNHWLAPEFGDVYVRFDPDAIGEIVDDKDTAATRIREDYKAGLRSREESRDAQGIEAEIPDDHHVLVPLGASVRTIAELDEPTPLMLPEPDEPDEDEPGDEPEERAATNGKINRLKSMSGSLVGT